MKKINILFVFLFAFLTGVNGQTAKEVIDKVSELFNGGVKASFTIETFAGNKANQGVKGNIFIQGEKFHINSPNYKTWFNGKTQWTYLTSTQEVNISYPSPEEVASMNPYTFINLYKTGYTNSVSIINIKGKPFYEVTLKANSKRRISEAIIQVYKETYKPYIIRFKQSNNQWTKLIIQNFLNNQKINSNTFTFNSKDYPQAEIIDLR